MFPKEEYEHIPYDFDTKPPPIVKGQSRVYTWRFIILRSFTFVSLELAFIALAWTAYKKRGIHLYINVGTYMGRSLAQSIFSWAVIIWNALAINALKDVVLYVFSAEWFNQNHDTQHALVTGAADRVSVLTSGLTDHISHFFSGAATGRYKVALTIFLLLLSSRGFVPGTISLDTGFVNVERELPIANVTFGQHNMTSGALSEGMVMGLSRATSFVKLEQLENTTYGYYSENVLIPWPGLTRYLPVVGADNRQFQWYTSDVMSYNFKCNWTTPTTPPLPTYPNRTTWNVELQGKRSVLRSLHAWDTPGLALPAWAGNDWRDHPLSVFVFRQLVLDHPNTANLVLDDRSSARRFNPPVPYDGKQNHTRFMMEAASILICDLQPRFYTAKVMVDVLNASLIATEVPHPTVGNFGRGFEAEIAVNIFRPSLTLPDFTTWYTAPLFNSLARLLFFCDPNDPCKGELRPFPLHKIERNMNNFFASGMKAYLDGYTGPPPGSQILQMPSFNVFTTNITIQENTGLLIVASLPFVVATSVAFVCTIFFLIVLSIIIRPKQLRTFDLATIVKVFGLSTLDGYS